MVKLLKWYDLRSELQQLTVKYGPAWLKCWGLWGGRVVGVAGRSPVPRYPRWARRAFSRSPGARFSSRGACPQQPGGNRIRECPSLLGKGQGRSQALGAVGRIPHLCLSPVRSAPGPCQSTRLFGLILAQRPRPTSTSPPVYQLLPVWVWHCEPVILWCDHSST